MPFSVTQRRLWLLAALLVLGVAIWAIETSHRFQGCLDEHSTSHFIHYLFVARRVCLGDFVHENAEPIIAAILAISTVALWVETRATAVAAKQSADHIPNVERGYIIGGGPWLLYDEHKNDGGVAYVSMGNYGKTPAIFKKLEWGFCDEKDFPSGMKVSAVLANKLLPTQTYEYEDVLQAGAGPGAIPATQFRQSDAAGKIFFGKFTYAILFDNKEHFSTFKLKVGTDGKYSAGLPGSYSDWS